MKAIQDCHSGSDCSVLILLGTRMILAPIARAHGISSAFPAIFIGIKVQFDIGLTL